jgi:tetratricopeptide (TPR) repeat protein
LNQALFVPNLFLGLDLLQLNRPGEAVPVLLTAEKLNPKDPQPALALGRAYHALWQPAKSGEGYRRAVALAPRNGEAWYGLGLAHFGLAEAAGAKLTGSFRESVYVADLTASACVEEGSLTEAIHAYRALLAMKAAPPRCSHTSYGFVLIRHGDPAGAEREFRLDLESCPAARVGMARLLFESGAQEKALDMLTDLASSDREGFDSSLPRFWEGLDAQQLETRLAQLRQFSGDMAGIVAARLREAAPTASVLEPEPSVPESGTLADLQRLASDAYFAGHFRTAALAADRLRQKYPNEAAGWYWAVRANQKLGMAALARAGEVEPDSPRIHALLGDAYQRRKMFDEAREEYSKVLAVSPDSVAGLAGLAKANYSDSKLAEARTDARKALARSPADSEINLLMGEILVAQREYADAEPYLEHSLHARPDLLPHVHALLGQVYARTGRPKEALKELTEGLSSDEDGSVHYQLANLYREAGDAKAAAAAFEESKRIRARHEALAQEMLAPVY